MIIGCKGEYMRQNYRIYLHCFIVLIFTIFGSLKAHAQNVKDYISISSPEPWVDIQTVPDETFPLSVDQKLTYKLISRQTQISKADRRSYSRYVLDLQNASAVEDEGTITVNFDPSYKKIKFHHIRVVNSDGERNVLNLEDGELFRTETDRDKLLFDGTLQFSFAIKGLKVGDRLDYAYTSYGKNPAYGDGYFLRQWQAYSTPTQFLHYRAVIAPNMPIHTKLHVNAVAPLKSKDGEYTVLTMNLRDIDGLSVNDDRPSWHYGYPAVEISSYDTWAAVGNHFAPYYRISDAINPQIIEIADEIKTATNDPKEQTRLALNYVQENIRYLGLEMGVGGFEPRQPSLVFERRFGDCKDVTLLLLTILKSLDIEAAPVLVHSKERAGFQFGLANHWAFDHVVVQANVEGKSYVLDATRNKQLGKLDWLDQGDFQKGLRLNEGASELVDMPQTDYAWRKDFYDEFDLVSHETDILYTLTANYYGEDADSRYQWYQDDGLKDIEKTFFEYFADLYPSIKIEKPTEVEIDESEARFTVKAYYRIVDGWELNEEKNKKTTWALPYELRADFPVFSGVERTAPYSIPYPAKVRQILAFKVDDRYSFDDKDEPYESGSFDYREVNTFKDELYKEVYTYETIKDNIPAKDAAKTLAFVDTTRDEFGITVQDYITPPASSDISEKEWMQIITGLFVLVGISAAIFAGFFAQNKDIEWRGQLVFHPVPLPKFILLSFVTLGHFQIYWIYKNWQWVKTVQKDDIWPIPRAIFASFMNFALFPRIAEEGDDSLRYKWFPILTVPLAILYFLAAALDRAIIRIPTLPDWLSVVSMFSVIILIPVAMQVNKYNVEKVEVLARNGSFSWMTWLLIAVYLPITLVSWYGIIIIIGELF